jgi:hypothetical protein
VLRGKFTAKNAYIKKKRDFSNNLMMNLKLLDKQEEIKPEMNR